MQDETLYEESKKTGVMEKAFIWNPSSENDLKLKKVSPATQLIIFSPFEQGPGTAYYKMCRENKSIIQVGFKLNYKALHFKTLRKQERYWHAVTECSKSFSQERMMAAVCHVRMLLIVLPESEELTAACIYRVAEDIGEVMSQGGQRVAAPVAVSTDIVLHHTPSKCVLDANNTCWMVSI
jgi:hypothetical protein